MCTISIHETTPKQLCLLNIMQTIDTFKYDVLDWHWIHARIRERQSSQSMSGA